MPELRWTLLVLGVLFIATLAILELRRQRHARGQSPLQRHAAGREGEPEGRVHREPTLTFPDLPGDPPEVDGRDGDVLRAGEDFGREELRADLPVERDRESLTDPPVVEIQAESIEGLRIDPESAVDTFSMGTTPGLEHEAVRHDAYGHDDAVGQESVADRDTFEHDDRKDADEFPAEEPLHVAPRRAEPHIPELAPANASVPPLENVAPPAEPIVEWPEEGARRIVALRLVSGAGERFSGRNVRLALAAEGFLPGKFDIFHKPGPDARAVLSAASLTKPGTFNVDTMDGQRFGGLSLFAVLPGPLSPLATFDELLTTAKALNDRLRGALQDERGEPLTPVRSASIRESLSVTATAAAPVVGPAGTADAGAAGAEEPTAAAQRSASSQAQTSPHAGPA